MSKSMNTGNGNLDEAIRCVDAMKTAGSTYERKGAGKAQTSKLASMHTRKNAGDMAAKPK